jgi:hypothetical protein
VKVLLFPEPLAEVAKKVGRRPRRQRLGGLLVPPDPVTEGPVTVGEWMRALRAARRLLAQELAELRAGAAP